MIVLHVYFFLVVMYIDKVGKKWLQTLLCCGFPLSIALATKKVRN